MKDLNEALENDLRPVVFVPINQKLYRISLKYTYFDFANNVLRESNLREVTPFLWNECEEVKLDAFPLKKNG